MFDDNQLQLAVLAELGWEPSITAAHLGVTADNGVITLTGLANSYAEKHAAETAARRVKGVLAVTLKIEVLIPFERKRSDDRIAVAVLDRLAWNASIPRDAVGVLVEKGRVTLSGEVALHYQREAAADEVRCLIGVIGLSNLIRIKPPKVAATMSTDIARAMDRAGFPDAGAIQITAVEGRVKLTGIVHSWQARMGAEHTAWGAPGAVEVENLLSIA